MSRINHLLRASLESHDSFGYGDPLASLEDYMEYRAGLEEYESTAEVQSHIDNMSESLLEIEGVIDESRNDNDLTEDQVQMQLHAVNAVRAVVDGDVAEISMESFASLESASLSASVESKGLLAKMWEAFLALLAKIKAAFQKMWAWITGSTKRTEEATKAVAQAKREVASGKTPDAETAKSLVIAKDKVLAITDQSDKVVKMITHDVKETAEAAEAVVKLLEGPITESTKQSFSRHPEKDNYMFEEINKLLSQGAQGESRASDKTTPKESYDAYGDAPHMPSVLSKLEDGLRKYTGTTKELQGILRSIDKAINVLESSANRLKKKSFDTPAEENFTNTAMGRLRKYVSRLQRNREACMKILQKGDAAVSSATTGAKKLSRAERKAAQARAAKGLGA